MADGWLSSLLGYHRLKDALNNVLAQRSTLKVIGGALTDDPDGKQSVLDLSTLGSDISAKLVPAQSVWDARVVPSGLHARSDQFTTNTIDSGKWTISDHGSHLTSATVDTARRCMEFRATGDGSIQWAYAHQAIPSNEFAALARISFHGPMGTGGSNPFVGLAVFENATSPSGDFASFDWQRDSNGTNWPLHLRTVTGHDGSSALNTRNMDEQPTSRWLRIRVSVAGGPVTSLWADWSSDGEHWNEYRTQAGVNVVTGSWTAQHFGLVFLNLQATEARAQVEHFRVWNGVSSFDAIPRNGGYLVAA